MGFNYLHLSSNNHLLISTFCLKYESQEILEIL